MKILDTNLTFAIRCANCGKIKFHNISTFQFLVNNKIDFYCDCNSLEMSIAMKDNKSILIDLPCLACDINHAYKYRLMDIFRKRVTIICCSATGFELCFLGHERDIKDIVYKYQENVNELLGELGLFSGIEDDLIKRIINKLN